MSQTVNSLLKLTAAAASLSFLVGCASQASDSMTMSDAIAAAEEAQATAADANAKAEAALLSANEAKEMAQEAGGLAQSAQYTADQNSQKIDRMFKKSMYK